MLNSYCIKERWTVSGPQRHFMWPPEDLQGNFLNIMLSPNILKMRSCRCEINQSHI